MSNLERERCQLLTLTEVELGELDEISNLGRECSQSRALTEVELAKFGRECAVAVPRLSVVSGQTLKRLYYCSNRLALRGLTNRAGQLVSR
jgi:hypothetical protein